MESNSACNHTSDNKIVGFDLWFDLFSDLLRFHEYDWVFKLSDYKLSDYKLSDYKLSDYRFPDQLVWNTEVYGPIKFKEIVICMIKEIIEHITYVDDVYILPKSMIH